MFDRIRAIVAAVVISITPISMAGVGASTATHTVKKGETIYGISKAYGISIETLLQYNPSARDGLKTGQELVLPLQGGAMEESPSDADVAAAKKKTYHTISKGQTLYSIAKSYGMTLGELLELNPGVDSSRYPVGTVLRLTHRTALPANQSTTRTQSLDITAPDGTTSKTNRQQPSSDKKARKGKKNKKREQNEAIVVNELSEEALSDENNMASDEVAEGRPLSIAMILPFMLNDNHQSKQAKLYTEFYKGFMLAADTLSHRGAPVKIYAFDSADNLDTVSRIMSSPEICRMSVIIAPDDQAQLSLISKTAEKNGTYVYNLFSVKDDTYLNNRWVMQANVPHKAMYNMATTNFMKRFDGFTPVFLSHITGKNEKDEFTQSLKSVLTENGVEYKEINYPNYLSSSDLKDLSADVRYVFIPASGSKTDFNKFSSALKAFKAEHPDQDGIRVFGYPEWVTFRGEAFDALCDLNSTIYSRFYNDTNAYPSRNLNASFRRWFGREMIDAVPSQGALGFDTGYFLIKALRDNDGDLSRRISPYEGIQSAFDFMSVDSDEGGQVNDALYFVYFRPGGFVEKIKL